MNRYGVFTADIQKPSVINYNRILEKIDKRNSKIKDTLISILFVTLWLTILVGVTSTINSDIFALFFGLLWGAPLALFFNLSSGFFRSKKVFVRGKYRKYL
jgi:hypothetical protein